MNQNNISPNQVAQVTQGQVYQNMSAEQLQRTQVLNFDDFKATARIEKISSKKPAAVMAFLGVTLIILGIFFPTIESLSSNEVDDGYPEYRETEKPMKIESKDELNCTLQYSSDPNGLEEIITVKYTFVDKSLKYFEKEYLLRKAETAPATPQGLYDYLAAIEPYLQQNINGYKMTLQQITDGAVTTVKIDYDLLDYTTIPVQNQENYRFNVPFQSTATLIEVTKTLTEQGYICK